MIIFKTTGAAAIPHDRSMKLCLRSAAAMTTGALALLAGMAASQGTLPAGVLRIAPISLGQPVQGSIGPNDLLVDTIRYDAYRLALDEGQVVQIDLSSSAFDAFLDVSLEPAGVSEPLRLLVPIMKNDDWQASTLDARLRFTAPKKGSYIIRAQSLDTTGPYVLTVFARRNLPPAQPKPLAVGTATKVTFDERTPVLAAGTPYTLYTFHGDVGERIRVQASSPTPGITPTLELVRTGNSGTLARNIFPAGPLLAVLPSEGEYTLFVGAKAEEKGSYLVNLDRFPRSDVDEPIERLPRTGVVPGNILFDKSNPFITSTGRIGYFYKDFSIEVTKEDKITVDLKSSEFDPVLDAGVWSPIGFARVLTSDDVAPGDNSSRLVIAPTSGGTVNLRVRTIGPATGAFTLTLSGANSTP
jgi:hypothetical protein